ncbi:hypothetical protein B5X24_HaOG213479 [Helicoverpa armigera]|uniref:BESS domain-containing protein n=1 Tax=Helicoverpa armigera TaxID=29058 RepID=A0A2W1BEY7_HELAM|nr:hypothetical protein B5X24_HaOG213479 [Helicoverpa armigera]
MQARTRTQRQASSQPSASASLMKYTIENEKKTEEDDHIDAFFKGLIPTLKRFSPYHQHLAKGKIFQVVQELEWEWLSSNPDSYNVAFAFIITIAITIYTNSSAAAAATSGDRHHHTTTRRFFYPI